jgi:hypothetical protein
MYINFGNIATAALTGYCARQNCHRTFMSIQSQHQDFPDHLAEAQQLLDDTTAKLKTMKESFRQKANTLCHTMTPKESFEFRLRSERVVGPGLSWDPGEEEEESEKGYDYTIYFGTNYWLCGDFMQFVEDDDRYTVEWGETALPFCHDDSSIGTMPVAFLPKEPAPHMLVDNDLEQDSS